MLPIALNHMTTPHLNWRAFLRLAQDLGCVGVECRNDIGPLFGGDAPELVRRELAGHGLRLLALAEVKRFNDWSPEKATELEALIAIAKASGAERISLIPRNDGVACAPDDSYAACHHALQAILPILKHHDIKALVEPLGFAISSLRDKAVLARVIDDLDAHDAIAMVHDSFHHALAGFGPIFPELTGLVHISGVSEPLALDAMQDGDRVLVDNDDLLANLGQLRALQRAGYHGPVSYEVFSPQIHALPDPASALRRSIEHLRHNL